MDQRYGGAVQMSSGFNRKRAEGRDHSDRPRKILPLKVRNLNTEPSLCFVQILGNGMDTQDTSPSVLLFFDNHRFIFNAGEGLQRYFAEYKIKLSKIDHILLSRVCSETAGGLPGLLLTLAGIGDEGMSVNVWGPLGLKVFVDAIKSFIPNAAVVHTHIFGHETGSDGSPNGNDDVPVVLVDNEVVRISALLLKPKRVASHESIEEFSSESGLDGTMMPGDVSVVYICELRESKGKLNKEILKKHGLENNPKCRELLLGNSVKSENFDIMVHPQDVCEASVRGAVIFLVDCPTSLHLIDVMSLECLNPYYVNVPESSRIVDCVIHLSPACITQTDGYIKWMSKFGNAQHIMAGHRMENTETPIMKSSATIAARLNYLCPQLFPLPGSRPPTDQKCLPSHMNSLEQSFLRVSPAENLLKFQLRTHKRLELDASSVPSKFSFSEIIDNLLTEIPEIRDVSQQLTQLWSNNKVLEEPWLHDCGFPDCLNSISRENMEIVLLGTGSSQPSKYRNVSSILVNLFSRGSMILDCGEGSLGQLRRRFGFEGADNIVRGLRCIWISHIHADHHSGLSRILAHRRDLLKGSHHEPLLVIGPSQLKRYLDAYQKLECLDMRFLDCHFTTEVSLASLELLYQEKSRRQEEDDSGDLALTLESLDENFPLMRPHHSVETAAILPIFTSFKRSLKEAGLEALISFPVVHCSQSFGVVLQAAKSVNEEGEAIRGWKLVYSGDTRPCPELVKASHGATVLIHEATFEDDMINEAIARNHSTTKEAVEVGEAAGVYRIILTHFSQRYPKIPVFHEARMNKTCIAFDMMSINLADIHLLPRVVPYLRLLFRDECEGDTAMVV